jgi:hypothetical protein
MESILVDRSFVEISRRQVKVGVEARTCGMNQVQCTVHTCSCLPRPGPGGINRQGAILALMQRFISLWWSSRTRLPPSNGCVTATWGFRGVSRYFYGSSARLGLGGIFGQLRVGVSLAHKVPCAPFSVPRTSTSRNRRYLATHKSWAALSVNLLLSLLGLEE